jgi:diadenylate cyclase
MDWVKIIFEVIVILAVIWYMYRTFHGTRGGMAMLGACIFFGVLIILVTVFKLEVIGNFLRDSYLLLILALIVVFQPELRRMFTGVGEVIFQRGNSNQRFIIEDIVRSVMQLQEKDLGALIAVERTNSNHPTRESGVVIDGKVTDELLVTIFTDKTPLHDGGVLISGEKIIVAGCIFPLTTRQDLDRNLGLRHRAALGFSEETDAVIVVLSEERGEISIAFRGALERNLTHDSLRQRLTELLVPKKKGPALEEEQAKTV